MVKMCGLKIQDYLQKEIVRHILNYLEGGVNLFNHKSSIYKDVTKS